MRKEQKLPNIVIFGGGHGYVVIQALIAAELASRETTVYVTTCTDNGGRSGAIRELDPYRELGLCALGDWCKGVIGSILTRDKLGQRAVERLNELVVFEGFEVPYIYQFAYQRLANGCGGDYEQVLREVEKEFEVRLGCTVLPTANRVADLVAHTVNNKEIKGESLLDKNELSDDHVVKVGFDRVVERHPTAVKRLEEADVVIIAPGSVGGSVLASMVGHGIKNLEDYQRVLGQAIQGWSTGPFDVVVLPKMSEEEFKAEHSAVAERYNGEGKKWLDYPDAKVGYGNGVWVVRADVEEINGGVCHDPNKLAGELGRVIEGVDYVWLL
jgi:uncharacterized cofD-like protein